MYPSLRMNRIFGNMQPQPQTTGMQPPDMNSGMDDMGGMLDKVMEFISSQNERKRQYQEQAISRDKMERNRLAQVATQIAAPRHMNPQDMDVVLGPGALQPARIGLPPDLGKEIDPKTEAQLKAKQDMNNANLVFKREQLNETNDYHDASIASKNHLGEESNAIRANRADVYRYKAMHPDMVFKVSKGGNIFGLDPKTGESIDTGVDSGTLSDEDKLNILGTQHISEIDERGQNNLELQGLRGNQSLAQIAARVAGQKDVNAAKPPQRELPTQQRVRQNMSAHELVNQHPDLARYVIFNGDGTFTVSKNAPSDVRDQINSTLYQDKSVPKTTDIKATKTDTTLTPPTAPTGWKYVRKPDNSGWTAVPDKGGK